MPPAQHSSFDRGFDVGHRDSPPAYRNSIEHELPKKEPASAAWKKYIAFAMVAIMVVSAFAMVAPSFSKKSLAPDEDDSARSEVNGAVKSVKYEISNVGWSYLKPTDYSKLGRSDHSSPGINQWFIPRNTNYNDTIVHNSYPYVISYNGYSSWLASQAKYKYLTAAWTTHIFYQLKVDAENITGLATGAQKDPWIVPIFHGGADPDADDGGWVNMSLYQNYLTDQEIADIEDGVHYANTWYGVNGATYWSTFHTLANDGWFSEIQGHWDFSRRAAHKFLGLPGTGNLITEYNAVGDATMGTRWSDQWKADGDQDGPLDIYAAYDYSLYTGNGPVFVVVKLDVANSTADKIALWFWSQTWGAEYLLIRYLEQVGIYQDYSTSREDWYLNGTFSPTNGDIHERMTVTYHMTAWKDPAAYNNPTWMFEPQHVDYTAERLSDIYMSKYDPYYWTYYADSWRPTRLCYSPGMSAYGQRVHYWQTPMTLSTTADESVKIILPSATTTGWGIEPYWSNNYSVPGNAALEMQANGVTGEFVLGHGYPAELYSTTYYDPATKTITLPAGKTWANNPNTGGYPSILESGSPLIYMDISPVSHYNLSIVQAGPYYTGQAYVLRVTPWTLANTQAYCNQTVELPAVSGVTYGTSSHTFAWNETSWDTTVTFTTPDIDYTLISRDQYFYLDITDTFTVHVGSAIPEFPTLLIPVIGAVAMFVVFGRRKTKK